jgi:sirohydrochlorin cobaltochelatase
MSTTDALLLIGHGSARYPDAGRAMYRHADTLRAEARFGQVQVALLNGTPTVADAMGRIGGASIRIVPFFMEDGYFTRIAVPRAIDEVRVGGHAASASGNGEPSRRMAGNHAPARIVMCPPVGIHDGMAGLIERMAVDLCAAAGIASRVAAVLVVGHGSAESPGGALALHRHSSRVAATELFARVEAACLEEPPFVADALHGLRAHPVAVVGFFANHGGHVRDDLPALIATEQAARGDAGHAVLLRGCIADHPAMTDIIEDQARDGQ